MEFLAQNPGKAKEMGQFGRKSTEEKFGLVSFGKNFVGGVRSVARGK